MRSGASGGGEARHGAGVDFLWLVQKNLMGNRVRSVLTTLSAAVLLLLFTSWITIVRAVQGLIAQTESHARIAVHHRTSFILPLPESYMDKLRAVPGVKAVTLHALYGGQGPDDRFQFPSIAADPESWPVVFHEYAGDRDLFRAWALERTGAIIGDDLQRHFGWQPGQTITLRGTLYPVDLQFKVIGVLRGFLNPQFFLMHKKYLEEAIGPKGVNMYWCLVDSVGDIPPVAQRIDRMFANSAAETMSESERDMFGGFLGTQSQVLTMVKGVGPLVLLIMVVVCGNTMGMAVRDRASQLAVMKCLGFKARYLLALTLAEGGLLTLAGGLVGSLGTWALFRWKGMGIGFGPLARIDISLVHVAAGIVLSLLVGVAAAAIPAYGASRISPIQTLRQVK